MNGNTIVDLTTALAHSSGEFSFFYIPLFALICIVFIVFWYMTEKDKRDRAYQVAKEAADRAFLAEKSKTIMESVAEMEQRHREEREQNRAEREEQNKFIRSLSSQTIDQGNLFVKLAESIHENTEATREMVRAVADMSSTVGYCRAINNIKSTQKKAKIKNVELHSTN